ncbi:hypothetical protein EPI10_022983 [Gossypium australe]|uniref:Uncharacterized protein n=1 Tax=Gossypium australe TaxID=47621 RepID=A0A5B6VU24_9ROSI|nr:hypothetical protein EPI10_022983 [Gossypium australe]
MVGYSLGAGSITMSGPETAEVWAIKIALDKYIGMGWHVKTPFVTPYTRPHNRARILGHYTTVMHHLFSNNFTSNQSSCLFNPMYEL